MTDGGALSARGLVYLSRDVVRALLPDALEQRAIADATFRALAAGRVELPPKPAVHPREDAFIHAMPTYMRDDDVAAVKWVAGYARNKRKGLPYIHAVLIVSDGETGAPVAFMDATEITAARTAAATAVCIDRFGGGEWTSVAIIGCGEQGRTHASLLRTLYPSVEIVAYDRHPERAAGMPGGARAAVSAADAVADADVVITALPLGADGGPPLNDRLLRRAGLVVAIDFDACVAPDVVAGPRSFLVDDRNQFEHYRSLGYFAGWRDPDQTIGAAFETPPNGQRVLCCPLGIAALDAAFAARVLRSAREQEVGLELTP